MIKRFYPHLLSIVFCFLISLPVIIPYLHPGYFPTHDGEWAVVRLGDMFRSLRDHQFPVRYSGNLNFGYGYPLFNFTYPAPYYIGVGLHFLKFGFVDTIKILFATSVFTSALGMYLVSMKIWGSKFAGMISSIIYIYYPYRIVDLYVRGSIGESMAFALFPFIILFSAKILDGKKTYLSLALGSLSYALLILTHNIMAVLFTPVLIGFIVGRMYFEKSKIYLPSIIFIVLGFILSAFFWVPALMEKNNILLSRIPIADRSVYFVKFYQLIIPRWGYGLPDHLDGFSYQIGLPQILVVLTVLGLLFYFWRFKKKSWQTDHAKLASLFLLLSFGFVLLMFSFTAFLWQAPLLREINYPWTLLGPVGFLISLVTGFLCLQNRLIGYACVGICFVSIILTVPYAKPAEYFDKGDNYYLTNDATTTSSNELMPLWVKAQPTLRQEQKVEIIKGEGSIQDIRSDSKAVSFVLEAKDQTTVRVNTIYYPGWKIQVDGVNVPVDYSNKFGVMDIKVAEGRHAVVGKFLETPVRLVADILSLLGFVAVIVLFGLDRFKKRLLKI